MLASAGISPFTPGTRRTVERGEDAVGRGADTGRCGAIGGHVVKGLDEACSHVGQQGVARGDRGLVFLWWACLTCRSSRRRSAALRGAGEAHAVGRVARAVAVGLSDDILTL